MIITNVTLNNIILLNKYQVECTALTIYCTVYGVHCTLYIKAEIYMNCENSICAYLILMIYIK